MASLFIRPEHVQFLYLGTSLDKVYSNNPCTEDGVANIQVVVFSMSLAELCATDNMLDIMHVFRPQ
jgi:hypothetical protein